VSSLTNVYVPEELVKPFKAASHHYGYSTMAGFFRSCVLALIEHRKLKEEIIMPLRFVTNNFESRK